MLPNAPTAKPDTVDEFEVLATRYEAIRDLIDHGRRVHFAYQTANNLDTLVAQFTEMAETALGVASKARELARLMRLADLARTKN